MSWIRGLVEPPLITRGEVVDVTASVQGHRTSKGVERVYPTLKGGCPGSFVMVSG